MIFIISGCTQTETPQNHGDEQGDQPTEIIADANILIAYFTWADNTVVVNPESVDVDASSSASVLTPGNAGLMARWIQEEVGGDLFSIQTVNQYSSDYDECLDQASREKTSRDRPALIDTVENFEEYDVIYLGFPNWWYTCPMAIFSFIESYDFHNKTVIPFVTHGTGGLSSTIRDLTNALPSVRVLDPIGIEREDVDSSEDKVKSWALNSLK